MSNCQQCLRAESASEISLITAGSIRCTDAREDGVHAESGSRIALVAGHVMMVDGAMADGVTDGARTFTDHFVIPLEKCTCRIETFSLPLTTNVPARLVASRVPWQRKSIPLHRRSPALDDDLLPAAVATQRAYRS
jgi:hypothetical protein